MHEDEFFLNLSEFVSVIDPDGSTRVVSKYALYREYLNRRNSAVNRTVGCTPGSETNGAPGMGMGSAAELEVPSRTDGW
jgi:hypothetical protein